MNNPNGYFAKLNTQDSSQSNGYFSKLSQATDTIQPSNTLPPIQADQSDSSWQNFQNIAQNVVAGRGMSPAILPVLLGQSAMESARGSAAPGNNYFGIKGSGNAGSNNMATQEYGSGGYYGENSNFGAYNTPADSINAYLDLIMNYRGVPEAIKSGDPHAIIQAIEANGYATSPTYIQDVMNTAEFKKYSGGSDGK